MAQQGPTPIARHAYCSWCGQPFAVGQPWPRLCRRCGHTSFLNPIPVIVVLVPVDEGVLVIRRGLEPRRGLLALPGGFIDSGETWQQAGAREVLEETGLTLDPAEIRLQQLYSAADDTLIAVGLAQPRTRRQLPPFRPTAEATERVVLDAPAPLAFDLHTRVVRAFLTQGAG